VTINNALPSPAAVYYPQVPQSLGPMTRHFASSSCQSWFYFRRSLL